MVEVVADATGAWNDTWTVWAMARLLSVLSTALKVTVSAVESPTVKKAWPPAAVWVEVLGVMTACCEDAVSVTDLPTTGLEPSSRVTVTVPVGPGPLAATVATIGVAVVTVESVDETAKLPNVTVTVCPVKVTLSVVSFAEYVTVSAVASDTLKVACPCPFVVADPVAAATICELPPSPVSEITLPEIGWGLGPWSLSVTVTVVLSP
jgi:hypothetical protein